MTFILRILFNFLSISIIIYEFGVDSCQISYNFPNVGAYIFLQNANYPNPYGNNIDCTYTFTSPVNTVMYLQCYDFNVQPAPNCTLDVFYYSLTGNANFTDKQLACGQGTFSQYSNANALTIGFKSDASNPSSSYPYRFSCMISTIQGCGLTVGQNLFCACTIISPNYVLTAAHCTQVIDGTKPLYVDIGDYDLSTVNSTRVLIRVTQIIKNSLYNSNTYDNDLALLKLEKTLSFSGKYIQPACLPWAFTSYNFQGQNVTASGWGTLTEGGTQAQIMQKVNLPILTTEQCRQYYGTQITNNMFCTYAPGKDTCQGDSGGSIDWLNPQNRLYYAIGVTSWGVGCAELNNPGVYVKVTNYLQWIQQNTPGETFCKP